MPQFLFDRSRRSNASFRDGCLIPQGSVFLTCGNMHVHPRVQVRPGARCAHSCLHEAWRVATRHCQQRMSARCGCWRSPRNFALDLTVCTAFRSTCANQLHDLCTYESRRLTPNAADTATGGYRSRGTGAVKDLAENVLVRRRDGCLASFSGCVARAFLVLPTDGTLPAIGVAAH